MRLIDADAIKEKFAEILESTYTDDYAKGFVNGLCAALNMPTLTPPNEWVSVEEKLPPPKQNVLAYSTRSGIAEADYADGVWMQYRWSAVMESVTHWMPLPEPPEKESEGR